jgi:hypothetical protein
MELTIVGAKKSVSEVEEIHKCFALDCEDFS